ncbi:MAG: hypothetical protein HY859_13390 [Caulobacterales bacterium]|nr:hypothetical protein [Caulobacterales bacterium]
MTDRVESILENIRELEQELEVEFAKARAGLRYGLEHGRARFEAEVVRRHEALRKGLGKYLAGANPLVVLTAPVIYSLIIPFVVMDLWVSAYQAICFPVYGIPRVKRGRYIVFDRSGLAYLNLIEKLNCAYCSYANGVAAYVREVAARTEQHWCPIKHARRVLGAHDRYPHFSEYGDGEHYAEALKQARARLKDIDDAPLD